MRPIGIAIKLNTFSVPPMKRYKDMTLDEKKEYHRESARRIARENPEKRKEYARLWRVCNPEKLKEIKRVWRLKNRDKVNAQKRASCKRNADSIRTRNLAYQRDNPDKCKVWRKRCYDKNPESAIDAARKRAGIIKDQNARLSRGLAKRLLVEQNFKCVLCPADLRTTKYHRDHIIALSKGGAHADHNIQLLCARCNLRKGAK